MVLRKEAFSPLVRLNPSTALYVQQRPAFWTIIGHREGGLCSETTVHLNWIGTGRKQFPGFVSTHLTVHVIVAAEFTADKVTFQ